MLVEILGGELDLGGRGGEEREHLYVRADVCDDVKPTMGLASCEIAVGLL